jgi:hypothetical protein
MIAGALEVTRVTSHSSRFKGANRCGGSGSSTSRATVVSMSATHQPLPS